jgi:hypothetical protein
MSTPSKTAPKPPASGIAAAAASAARPRAAMTCGMAWVIPGAGHFLQGQAQKAVVFFVVLVAMFVFGLSFGGRIFPFQVSDPLVFLAAAAQWALGGPRLLAALAGWGPGEIVAATYEYGNTFLIVGGLLNALVVLDAFDLASGRKRQA